MKSIIFLGLNKSGSSREAVKAAKDLGYYTVVFTNQEKQINQRNEYPDVHQMILVDINNLDEVREQIKLLQQRGNEIIVITSFVANYAHTASVLADEFCENRLSTNSVLIMVNKERTRTFFANESFTPKFLLIGKGEELPSDFHTENFQFPFVIKVSTSTGSKDVLFAGDMEELEKGIGVLRRKFPEETIIMEEYIDGEQYLVEVLVSSGEIHIAATIKQEITKGKRFIVTGYGVLAEIDPDFEDSLMKVIDLIVSQLNLQNGVFHLELRLGEDGWKLIEINPRISGGAMNSMIQAAFGFSLVEETLKMLVGEEPDLTKETNQFVFTQYVIVDKKGILEKVTGKKRARATPGVVEVYVKPKKETLLIPPLSMGHRYAYVIAIGDTLEEAESIAKEAAAEIEFHILDN